MRKILPADTLTPILAYMRVQGNTRLSLNLFLVRRKMHVFLLLPTIRSLK